jgi:hypothetical protein
MTVVHKQFARRLKNVSYVQFTRYVHRFVGRKEKLHATLMPPPQLSPASRALMSNALRCATAPLLMSAALMK